MLERAGAHAGDAATAASAIAATSTTGTTRSRCAAATALRLDRRQRQPRGPPAHAQAGAARGDCDVRRSDAIRARPVRPGGRAIARQFETLERGARQPGARRSVRCTRGRPDASRAHAAGPRCARRCITPCSARQALPRGSGARRAGSETASRAASSRAPSSASRATRARCSGRELLPGTLDQPATANDRASAGRRRGRSRSRRASQSSLATIRSADGPRTPRPSVAAAALGTLAVQLLARLDALGAALRRLRREMDFDFLFDPTRRLFSIGYRVEDGALDASYYDLLASEARLASLFAIAKGDVPPAHWFHLGRPLAQSRRRRRCSRGRLDVRVPDAVAGHARPPSGTLLDQT